jgi:hypothetical protein
VIDRVGRRARDVETDRRAACDEHGGQDGEHPARRHHCA